MSTEFDHTNLWLAKMLFELGGISFGNFTLGRSTVNSPIYLNPRVLISSPRALKTVAEIVDQETQLGQARRRPTVHPFDLVAGVPVGGLHLATAFSLRTDVPLIYPRTSPGGEILEGRYREGQTVLLIDDLITTGGSILETGSLLKEAGLEVKDAIVLIDREQGAERRLREHGYNLISILRLKTLLNYYRSNGLIDSDQFERSMRYIETHQAK
ncbi:MAG TPA: phosphoribosyltransferase family protein [Dehalococcoidia bacterium]|nr:phosphoribosyltransferase family protein [Dehalococcoidia bacterium]